jgi:hypothetical protein
MGKKVKDFWRGSLTEDLKRTLNWLLSRQNAPVGNWLGNAQPTDATPPLFQCGIRSVADFSQLAQAPIENIYFHRPTGILPDYTGGPDGFPINYSDGTIFCNSYTLTEEILHITGHCSSLLEPPENYRVDFFLRTDAWYYKGSASLEDKGNNTAHWYLDVSYHGNDGAALAALYPTSIGAPAPGWYGADIPAGWKAHTNTGIGKKLVNYFARVYSKTDIEYLKEDNIPIIIQDHCHARVGSEKAIGSGTPTMHIIYNDPVVGPISVFTTQQHLAIYDDLPRSLDVPTSDPKFVPDISITNSAACQNRCWIYDGALAILVYAYAGNFLAAKKIITRLNKFLDDREYLAQTTLENCEDGSTARWTVSGDPEAYAEMWNDPLREPYGAGKQMRCHAEAAGDTFTYIGPAVYGSGLPDSTDHIIQWQFRAHQNMTWYFEVALTTQQDKVQKFKVTSDPETAPTYDSDTKTITYPIGPGNDDYHFHKFDLKDFCQDLASDTWTSTTGFKAVLNEAGEVHLDNISLGILQPVGSLSFSYDIYNGLPDQVYIRTGAMAWLCYAYALYMEMTKDYTPALYLQKMLGFLLTLEFTGSGLRNGLLLGGYGAYEDPGYHYVPGLRDWCSTEHNIDAVFAFKRAAKILPIAAIELRKRQLITAGQAVSLNLMATTVNSKADNIISKILTNLYIPPGYDPGHFAQGVHPEGLDTAVALDAAGSWAAIFCREAGDDTKAAECLKFIYEKLFLSSKTIAKSSQTNSWNMAFEQLTPFDGFTVYGDGYENPPPAVWQEGTWGVIAALLRCYNLTAVQAYFASHETNLDAFLTKLIRGQQTVLSTTGNPPAGGLVNFSLASRSLPYEFTIWAGIGSTAWFWLVASNAFLVLTEETEWELRPYLKVPRGVEQRIEQLEGHGSIGALELEAIDGGGLLTGLASGGNLEGRKVTLKVGYAGLDFADFATLATQQIESVQVLADYTGYRLQCRDLKRSAKSKVFLKGDDGLPISNDHPRQLSANPIDVALVVFQNELGVGQISGLPSGSWLFFDPTGWVAESNPTLLGRNVSLDIDTFLFYRHGIFAGYVFDFVLQQPVEAKQFLEYEIFKSLGGYLMTLADGRLSPRFFVPPYDLSALFMFSDRNMTLLPGMERHPIINQVSYRMDYPSGDGNFQTELLFVYAPSLEHYGLAGQHIIESKGMSLARGGASLAGITANRIFRRYGGIDPVSAQPSGGAVILTATSHHMTLTVEVGDYVWVNHPLLPDFVRGVRGIFSLFEVIEKQPNFPEGTMTYKLLDASWLVGKKLSKVAPDETPAWPDASASEREKYMFICSDTTKEYSDGTAGKTIW